MLIYAIIISAAGCGIMFGTFSFLKKRVSVSVGAERAALEEQIAEITESLSTIVRYKEGYVSTPQYDGIASQLDSLAKDLEGEKEKLKDIEGRLDGAQKNVEEKETHQQEIKSAKEEDEIKLEELLNAYEEVSSESISLEQKLAQSLKNLDDMKSNVELTQEQQLMVDELSNALVNAGSRLRDLITEYQTVNERLEMLKEQHTDLEEEYTRLVEQQLGE